MRQRSQPDGAFYDGVVNKSLSVDHDGEGFRLSALTHQDCSDILDHNKAAMREGGSKTLSFGKAELCIPELVLQQLKRKYPELDSGDREIKVKAWKKFLGTAEAKPWKVSQKKYG